MGNDVGSPVAENLQTFGKAEVAKIFRSCHKYRIQIELKFQRNGSDILSSPV
jgi:hypothetical protein